MKLNIQNELGRLASFAIKAGLIDETDLIYSINQALEVLELDDFSGEIDVANAPMSPVETLERMLDWAFDQKLIESNTSVYRDLFDSKLMNTFTPRPSEVVRTFKENYYENPTKATNWYYKFSQDTNYIRMNRIAKNRQWKAETEFGALDITINLSKPEKDPKAIAAARKLPSSGYPKCLLCCENEGYAGRINHPGRHSHRIIPLDLIGEKWFLQYSPYVYYNEHSIILKEKHEPMKIGRQTFERLLDFVEKFPHYFIGSNADLPIVGGSILSHDHFQGGRYTFAMENAKVRKSFEVTNHPDVAFGMLNWPMSVIRLRADSKSQLVEAAEWVFAAWKEYSDLSVDIQAYTKSERHNTVTPIARHKEGAYELDLVLRNNRMSDEHPLGIFHPHSDVHHIKKENIGLIEVMGLAVLPARLEVELRGLAQLWIEEKEAKSLDLKEHLMWLETLKKEYAPSNILEAREILEIETGKKFLRVLEDAGVFKNDASGNEAFERFTKSLS